MGAVPWLLLEGAAPLFRDDLGEVGGQLRCSFCWGAGRGGPSGGLDVDDVLSLLRLRRASAVGGGEV